MKAHKFIWENMHQCLFPSVYPWRIKLVDARLSKAGFNYPIARRTISVLRATSDTCADGLVLDASVTSSYCHRCGLPKARLYSEWKKQKKCPVNRKGRKIVPNLDNNGRSISELQYVSKRENGHSGSFKLTVCLHGGLWWGSKIHVTNNSFDSCANCKKQWLQIKACLARDCEWWVESVVCKKQNLSEKRVFQGRGVKMCCTAWEKHDTCASRNRLHARKFI